MSDQQMLIIVPTYNEVQNIHKLVEQIYTYVSRVNVDLLFIDDASPDGTADLVAELASLPLNRGSIHLLRRKAKLGLGSAYRSGFHWALKRGYFRVMEMDADLSHDAKYLPAMLSAAKQADVVVASRYCKGGGTKNWPWSRRLISRGGCLYAKWVLGVRLSDLTGGFNLWSRKALLAMDLGSMDSEGYVFQIELKYRALLAGLAIVEVPFIFVERCQGESKMSSGIFWEAVKKVWQLRVHARFLKNRLALSNSESAALRDKPSGRVSRPSSSY
ncbi:MAG: polyprenol monophosphomannose synthase [Zetaproteobacteria bacterium]|nr:polyprenol monophosphomannose synthase [Zetaproteobacteria bacterium]